MTGSASAANVGVAMAQFDDNFLTVLRNGMIDYAKTLPGVTLQVEDGGNDVNKQLSEIQNFIASKVDAIVVNPVDTSATAAIPTPTSRWSTSTASRPISTRYRPIRHSWPPTKSIRAPSKPSRSASC
jgi:ABC-type xylose transport system substrate-binding protein